ncbi:hypothetical protein HK405_002198, partial [Cladochytrium tenue]
MTTAPPLSLLPTTAAKFFALLFSTRAVSSTLLPPVDYETCAARTDVQELVSLWSQAIGLAGSLPAFLVAPVVGHLVDRHGRRAVMLAPLVLALLDQVATVFVVARGGPLGLLVVARLLQGLAGGIHITVTCAYAYIADTTDAAGRTQSFLYTDACLFAGVSLGPLVGGVVYKNFGMVEVVYVAAACMALALVYVLFYLPESLHARGKPAALPPADSTAIPEDATALQVFARSWARVPSTLTPPGRGRSVLYVASVL